MYVAKWGLEDKLVTNRVPCIVHAIFDCCQPHGTIYCSISEYMVRKNNARCEVLPFIVDLPRDFKNLREQLGIPASAKVFGRHGGYRQFDVAFMQAAVREILAQDPDIFFVFMNTRPFVAASTNLIYLAGSPDPHVRSDFVHACDAMIHGRSDGETFGLACGEFSLFDKPIITTSSGDLAHISILQNNCIICSSQGDAVRAMRSMAYGGLPRIVCDQYRQFTPEAVIHKFSQLIDRCTGDGSPLPTSATCLCEEEHSPTT